MSYFIALCTILEIPDEHTQEELKAAYKKMAKKYHPDINRDENAPKIMQKITFAYEVLSNPDKKIEYELEQREKRKEQQKKISKQKELKKRRKKSK